MRDKNKSRGPHRKPAPIDGIVPRGQNLGAPVHRSYQPSRDNFTPTLGGEINRIDGFHPARQSPGGIGGTVAEATERDAVLNEPIVLDDLDYDKRKDKVKVKIRRARWRKILKRTGLALLIILIAGAAYMGGKFYLTQKRLFHGGGKAPVLATSCDGDVPPAQLNTEGDGRINILLLGIGGPGHDGGNLTDTIMLASIDPETHQIALLSIPRDLWVRIPNDGYQKINAAYYYGTQQSTSKKKVDQQNAGLSLLDRTLQPVIGTNIHYHVIIDFKAFQQSVDAVGGIDVNVPEQLYDPTIAWENHYNAVIAAKGIQHFNGKRALLYAKSRETSSDFARAERQRLILVALKDKVFSAGTFANPIRISSLLDSLGSNVYTDFDTATIKCIYTQMGKIPSNRIKSLDLVTPPNNLLTTGNMNGLSIVEPRAGLFNYDAIKDFTHKSLRDGFIARENAAVAVYNGTTTLGLATSTANTLKSYGYRVTTVGDATSQTGSASTVIVDLTKGVDKYTRHYLEQRYGVLAVSKIPSAYGISPPQGTSFVIIVGSNATVSG